MKGKPLISTLCFIGTMLQCTGAYAYSSTKTGNKGGTNGDIKLNIILLIILVLLVTVSIILFLKKRKGKKVKNNETESGAMVIKPAFGTKDKKEQLQNNVSLYCINGEYLGNGVRLSPGVPYIMNHSDEFYLGSRNNLFVIK